MLSVTENPQHAKDIKVGSTIKLLKPIMLDNETLQTNKSFRPIKSRTAIELTPSEEEISRFDTKTEERKVSTNLATFKMIQDNYDITTVSSLTAMVEHLSRIIETNAGKYQIVGLIDTESEKMSINLFSLK